MRNLKSIILVIVLMFGVLLLKPIAASAASVDGILTLGENEGNGQCTALYTYTPTETGTYRFAIQCVDENDESVYKVLDVLDSPEFDVEDCRDGAACYITKQLEAGKTYYFYVDFPYDGEFGGVTVELLKKVVNVQLVSGQHYDLVSGIDGAWLGDWDEQEGRYIYDNAIFVYGIGQYTPVSLDVTFADSSSRIINIPDFEWETGGRYSYFTVYKPGFGVNVGTHLTVYTEDNSWDFDVPATFIPFEQIASDKAIPLIENQTLNDDYKEWLLFSFTPEEDGEYGFYHYFNGGYSSNDAIVLDSYGNLLDFFDNNANDEVYYDDEMGMEVYSRDIKAGETCYYSIKWGYGNTPNISAGDTSGYRVGIYRNGDGEGKITKNALTVAAQTGGNVNASIEGEYEEGTIINLVATPLEGYIFDGWVSTDGGEFEDAANAKTTFTMPANATIVTAKFKAENKLPDPQAYYTLTVTAQTGGSVNTSIGGQYEEGTVIDLIATPLSGYIFDGWISSNGGIFKDAANAKTTFAMPANATIVTAKFKAESKLPDPQTYTLSFDTKGGNKIPAKTGISANSKVGKPSDPKKKGFIFAGWFKDASCKNKWDFNKDTIKSNTKLYAKWTVIKGKITPATKNVKKGNTLKLKVTGNAAIKSVKWSTSNKKYVSISKKSKLQCTVKGVKKGKKATIKAIITFKDGTKKTIKRIVHVK